MVAGCAECCFAIKEFEAEDEAACRKNGRQRRSRRSKTRENKRKQKELLAEEFAASTGTPMYVVPPVSMKQSAKQSATTMKQPK